MESEFINTLPLVSMWCFSKVMITDPPNDDLAIVIGLLAFL